MKAILKQTEEHEVVPLPLHSSVPKQRVWPLVVVGVTNLALVALVAFLVRAVMIEKEAIRSAISTQMAEMEQLRVDVVTTSSENSLFLKIMLLKPGIDKGLARDIAHSIALRAREHHRDPDLVLAIIDVESDFNPNAVSHMGAMGLMQIMPMWKNKLGIQQDLRHIDTSIDYGLKILAFYEVRYKNIEMALTAYNKGETLMDYDLKAGRNPMNGYAESIMRTYSRIKSWMRP